MLTLLKYIMNCMLLVNYNKCQIVNLFLIFLMHIHGVFLSVLYIKILETIFENPTIINCKLQFFTRNTQFLIFVLGKCNDYGT